MCDWSSASSCARVVLSPVVNKLIMFSAMFPCFFCKVVGSGKVVARGEYWTEDGCSANTSLSNSEPLLIFAPEKGKFEPL